MLQIQVTRFPLFQRTAMMYIMGYTQHLLVTVGFVTPVSSVLSLSFTRTPSPVSINTEWCACPRQGFRVFSPPPFHTEGRIGLLAECEWHQWNWREEEKGFDGDHEKKGNKGEECRPDYSIAYFHWRLTSTEYLKNLCPRLRDNAIEVNSCNI